MTTVVEEVPTSAMTNDADGQRFHDVESKNQNVEGNRNAQSFNVLNNIPTLSPCSPATPASSGGVKKAIQFSNDHNAMEMNEDHKEAQEKEDKIDEILNCLNGVSTSRTSATSIDPEHSDDEKVVDLWHLRELAISKHGLVNANIRKRAWPKLVGANEHILNSSIASLPTHFSRGSGQQEKTLKLNDLPETDIVMIKKDIAECVWNIEDEIKLVRRKREEEKEIKRSAGIQIVFKKEKIGGEDASIASLDSGVSSITAGRITPQLIPEAVRAFPRFGSSPGVNAFVNQSPSASGASTPVSGIATPNTLPSITPIGIQNLSINENSDVSSTIKKSKARYLRKRKEERRLLLNIITSVLRTVPNEEESSDIDSDLGVDDDTIVADNIKKLYYFKGMHNLVGPILITLESPSLTSLVVNRLAQSHLRDAMGSTFDNIQAGIRLLFMPLLEKVDKPLHDYLIKGGLKDPCIFALQWVLCWFTTDVPNYDIIGRLYDVFITSHASFPVYFSVAMLTHAYNKGRVMMTPCEESALKSVIFSLPSTSAENIHAMDMIEDMIKRSLNYMRSYPIQKLLSSCKKNSDSSTYVNSLRIANTVSFFRKPPAWAYAATTATDWTLIKQAKALRGLSPVSRLKKQRTLEARNKVSKRFKDGKFLYESALDASGLSKRMKDSIRCVKAKHIWATNIALLLLFVVLGTAVVTKSSYEGFTSRIHPATPKIRKNKFSFFKMDRIHTGNLKREAFQDRTVVEKRHKLGRIDAKKNGDGKSSKRNEKLSHKKDEIKPTKPSEKQIRKTDEQKQSVMKSEGSNRKTSPTIEKIFHQLHIEKAPAMKQIEKSNGLQKEAHQQPVQYEQKNDNDGNRIGRTMKRIKEYLQNDTELLIISF